MKNLFKRNWFLGLIIISLMLVVFFLNLWIMSLELIWPYRGDNLWSLAVITDGPELLNIFAFSLKIAFYLSIVPILLSVFSALKKNSWGFMVSGLFLLFFETAIIVFQAVNHYLSVFALVLTIINIALLLAVFVFMIIRNRRLPITNKPTEEAEISTIGNTKIPLYVLIIDIISILIFLTTFMIPLYTVTEHGQMYHAVIINVLLSSDTHLAVLIYFLVNFIFFLSIMIYFANTMSRYFFDKERFIRKSKTLISLAFISTLMFFFAGLGFNVYYTLNDIVATTIGYIPLLLMIIVEFAYAIFKGKHSSYYQIENKQIQNKYAKIEPLLYIVLLTAITVLMLLLPIIKIQITTGGYDYSVNLTGFNLLQDYANLDPGYRLVSFILVSMLISIGLALVLTLISYLSKSKQFSKFVKSASAVNVFFVFIIAISGYYFKIANQINQVVVVEIFDFYGIHISNGVVFDYVVGTDAIYALIASVLVLILMFLRKAFDRDDFSQMGEDAILLNASLTANGETETNTIEEEINQVFDPCPAFTELDLQADNFTQDLETRKNLREDKSSLNDLIYFVVEYARNSRLHLSYTPEDIATFVAGLGASKLSILQGMSGTGKTSLPKIFSEAILGNCEIVEVESSWKDKNELLGYYNEFSMKYTPKKFTLALYKAALNPEICTFILLDEMNLSRIEYYFSDFLSLMENEEGQREIKLVNIKLKRKEADNDVNYLALENDDTLKVSPNIWFIGTANRDESTFVISDKVYDRAHTMNFTKRAPKVRNYSDPIPQKYYDYETINDLLLKAKENGDFDAENNELIKKVEVLLAPYNISFGNRILKQIEDFVNIYKACFDGKDVENEAIEKILLSKVVAKLELKIIDDKESLEMEFEKLHLNQCLAFVKQLDNE